MLRWKSSLKPAAAAPSSDNPGTANLVGDWSMDETSGTRADSHGSNDLTDNNTVGSTTGVISNAASFVAANSEYLSSTTVPVSGTGARSFEVWFKTSTSGTLHIAGFGGSGGANGSAFRISIENGSLFCRVFGGFAGFGGSWNDGAWHQVVLKVMDSGFVGDLEMYVDGSSQTRVSGSNLSFTAINTGTDSFFVGQNIDSGATQYFDGDVDIVRVFNDELTADEITWLYNSGSGRSYSDISGATDITLETSAVTTATSFSSPLDIDVNIPAVSTNDILLLFAATNDGSSPTDSPPSGWTKIVEQDGTSGSHSTVAAYWKRASSSAAATTETWSAFYTGSESYYIWVGAYSGCVTSGSPVDANGTAAISFSSSWSVDVTTNVSDTMIVTASGSTNSTATQTWTDGTELIDAAYESTAVISINEKLEATSGTKTRASTPSTATSASMIAVALRDTAPTPLQTRTVTFNATDASTFTIDSDSGQEIWTDDKLNQASVGDGLRFWNGSEAGNSGATYDSGTNRWSFSSASDSVTWWESYWVRVKQDPGTGTYSDWIYLTDANGDIEVSAQAGYNNIGSTVTNYSGPGTWTTHAAGFKYQVEIYSDSNRP